MDDHSFGGWLTEELQSLLERHIFDRDHFAETFTDRANLNKEIQLIKNEIIKRERKK